MKRHGALLIVLTAALLVSGCVRGCKTGRTPWHFNPNMDEQPRADPQEESDFFYNGMVMREPVEGSVPTTAPLTAALEARLAGSSANEALAKLREERARVRRDALREEIELYTGKDAFGDPVPTSPVPVSAELLARGERQFMIFCAPCHDPRGTGKGILFTRGNVPTTSLLDPRLVDETDGHIFDVVTNGLGLMKGYRSQMSAHDRWAVVAHARRLQGKLDPTPYLAAAE